LNLRGNLHKGCLMHRISVCLVGRKFLTGTQAGNTLMNIANFLAM